MKDKNKTKEELISELIELRMRNAELQRIEQDFTNRKLEKSESSKIKEKLEFLLTNNPAVIYTCEYGGNWAGIFMSENIKDLLGYEAKDFIENQDFWVKGIHPDDKERIFSGLENLLKNDYHSHEYRFLHKDGNYRWVFDEIRVLRDKEGNPYECIGYWTDITERKKVEEALKENENFLKTIIDTEPECIKLLSPDGTLQMMNCAGLDMIEADSLDQVKGQVIYPLISPEYLQGFKSLTEQVFQGKSGTMEFEITGMRGRRLWLETHAVPLLNPKNEITALLGITRDITERKKSEEIIQNSERFLANIFDCIQDGISILDKDMTIIRVNSTMEKWYKHAMPLVGNKCYQAYHGRKEECDVCPTRNTFHTGRSSYEVVPKTGAGGQIEGWMDLYSYPIIDNKTGEMTGVIEYVRDITERKKAEEEKEKLEDQLRHAQRMEAVGQIAGGVAHDFNNILSAIIGHGNLLQMEMKKDTPSRIHLEQILAASERGANLIQSLLAFSRKQIISPRPIDLNDVVTRVGKLLIRVIGEDIKLKTICAEEAVTVMADSGHIEQVLMNLVTNARDSMPEGGMLIIETGLVEIDDEFIKRHAYGKHGKYALISVTDSGEGMDKETRQRIFEPFFTTKEIGKGTGLGLSMVYGIIKQHDGFIDVHSEPGKGTKVKIYLPEIKIGVKEAEIKEPSFVEGGTETVLVAEDDEAVRRLSREILERFGYTVIEAEDGEDAIQRFMENKDKINLLLLDVVMPKKDGKVVYKEIKKIKPDIKVLFLSGYPADLIRKKGILEEGIDFIAKPVRVDDLLRKAREVLDT
jgi:PAS domain S-box-containing protein